MDWRDIIKPAKGAIVGAATAIHPIAGMIAEHAVGLAEFGIEAAQSGMSREQIVIAIDERTVDLLRQIKTGT